jgi:hypothetical protein
LQQRQREAQIQALRRDGIFIEDEYMDEIYRYMLEMEVGHSRISFEAILTLDSSAVHHVVHTVNGSTARDQVAHEAVSS